MFNFSDPYKKTTIYRFSLALVLFSIAFFFRYSLFAQGGLAFVTFYPAIILSFYFCGTFPGVLVVALSAISAVYFFMKPLESFVLDTQTIIALIFFGVTSSLIGFFISRLHTYIQELSVILDNEMVGSLMLRNREILWCNKAISEMFGYPQSELIGSSTVILFQNKTDFDELGRSAYPLPDAKPYRTQIEMKRADGKKVWVDLSGAPISYDASLSLWLFNDISKLKNLEKDLKHQVDHDFLTGLNARGSFMNRSSIELNRALRAGSALALLMVDIDFFKRINDSHGHQAGDWVLKSVADVFRNTLRDFDICGRLGGEEFAILLPGTDKDKAFEVAERLRLAIENTKISLLTQGLEKSVTVSVGLSSLTSKEDTIDLLISQADAALYQAKNSGRNRVCTWMSENN